MCMVASKNHFLRYKDHTSQHFRDLLKLNDIPKLQELLFMHDFEKNQLPKAVTGFFVGLEMCTID